MSHSGSGASTPRSGGVTPTPPSGEGHPSPLKVGINFVRQYYKVLSETPDQIFRFYQPTSFLSEGVGAQKTHPVTFEEKQQDGMTKQLLKDRFYLPHHHENEEQQQQQQQEEEKEEESCPIRFEFENGAIDAQLSVNGGVLLVVTGQVVYLNVVADEDADEEEEEKFRKAFVHTFFLASIMVGTKRSYYVHNDVLRFLDDSIMGEVEAVVSKEEEEVAIPDTELVVEKETKVDVVEPALMEEEPKVVEVSEEVVTEAVTEKVDEKPAAVAVATNHAADENEAPGNGVEETKEELLIDEMVAAVEEKAAPIESSKSSKAVAPGSWASLVARSGGGSTSSAPTTPAGTPVRPTKAAAASSAKPKTSPVAAAATTTTTAKTASNAAESAPASSKPRPGRRDPECTLVIKNVADGVTEADVLGLFEPFAVKTGTKVANLTVSTNRAIAFVDYDSPAPVLAAIEQGQKEAFRLKDRVLEIYQKTVEQRVRRSSGGGGRSGQRGGANGSSSFRGGGRQQHRRGAGGRGGGRSGGGSGSGGR